MFQRDTGHKVAIVVDSAPRLAQRIGKGEAFDVVVMPQQGLERMIGEKKIFDDSISPLAQSGFGVAVSLSAIRPDITNPEAFRRTLLAARSVTYVDPVTTGAGDLYLEQLFQNMGILFEMRAKTVPAYGGYAGQLVASGRAEIAIQLASDLLVVPGVQFVGLLPPSLQRYTVYSGAVSAGTKDVDLAVLLLEALVNADEGILRRRGMEVPTY
jgi:molybdate transport system substrate-binding protein